MYNWANSAWIALSSWRKTYNPQRYKTSKYIMVWLLRERKINGLRWDCTSK